MIRILTRAEAREALSIRDLSDPDDGRHALQLLIDEVTIALCAAWRCSAVLHRAHPVVSVEDNYDRLRYPSDGPARDARHTRYVSSVQLLRSHTSAMVPPLLKQLDGGEVLLVCPGLVYRRDVIDRIHTGEPHQLDLWRLTDARRLAGGDLRDMITRVVAALLPGRRHRVEPAVHPYTVDGLQIDVEDGDGWIEVGECGLAHPEVLARSGLDSRWNGLAMGLGLDRLLMLRKGIDDIRLLRSPDPRVAGQMLDLEPYRAVSNQPAVVRDLSLVVDRDLTPEEIGDRVRAALRDDATCVEEVQVVAETGYDAMPPRAIERLGMGPDHKNALVRVVLRDLSRTLSHAEANRLRNLIYAALHQGTRSEWADSG
jgi:phenylalanyl-tRNA synthetase alpha chain